VFINLYRDGSDFCPYNKDVYIGETRDLLVNSDQKGTRAIKYKLESGDLYYMVERLHHKHKHSVPKRTKGGIRISVVFFTN
jgi:hypothetical protein